MIVFLAVPAAQRTSRNDARKNNATLLLAALNQCMTDNNQDTTYCSDVANISLPQTGLTYMDGYMYGSSPPTNFALCGNSEYFPYVPAPKCPPSYTRMNYEFGLYCPSLTSVAVGVAKQIVVTFRVETGEGAWTNLCIGDGNG
jgi:hypothetical protein